MIYKIDEFCYNISANLNSFIDNLAKKTGRSGQNERAAWAKSLPEISAVLSSAELQNFHLYLNEKGTIITEYQLPSSSFWCDIILIGNDGKRQSVVIIELKDWDTKGTEEGPTENLIQHHGVIKLHPSDQVKGYANYLNRFHSVIQKYNAAVNGCVYFTSSKDAEVFKNGKHLKLSIQYPLFSRTEEDQQQFPKYLNNYLKIPDEKFAKDFEKGYYQQDRNLILQVARNFIDEDNKPFELLDEQRKGFEVCLATINKAFEEKTKKVIIIHGGPGSGKSVLAANLWAESAKKILNNKNIVFTTTSGSQRSNWENLFRRIGRDRIANGIVMPANKFNPGLSPKWQSEQKDLGKEVTVESWKQNLKLFAKEKTERTFENMFHISIVDEAHALIDPSKPGRRGIPPSGWSVHAGPQGWHIIKCSEITVFLLDGNQSYRDNETTTIEDIENYASDHNAEVIKIDLGEAQFRCGGSIEYIHWLENLLEIENKNKNVFKNFTDKFEFRIFEYLDDMENSLKEKFEKGNTVRLAASYAKEWVTKNESSPHKLKPTKMDFHFKYNKNGDKKVWSKIWNFAPKQDYTLFVQAPKHSQMYKDPLSEVGCPYVIRGFDYDYIGLLWLKDLIYKNGWEVDPNEVYESSIRNTRARARKGGNQSSDYFELLKRIAKGYRILLTRPIKGIYIWFEDKETEEYIKKKFSELV